MYVVLLKLVDVLNSLSELLSVIVKWGDDLRQECLASQLLEQFKVCCKLYTSSM